MERLFSGILYLPISLLLTVSGNNPLIVLLFLVAILVICLIGKYVIRKRGTKRIRSIFNTFFIIYLVFLLFYSPLFLIWIAILFCSLTGGGGSCYI